MYLLELPLLNLIDYLHILLLFYYKKILGSFIRSLLIAEAYSPETAKTIEELGQNENYFVLRALKKGKGIAKVINSVANEGEETKYFVSEDNLKQSLKQYADNSSTIWTVIISIVAFAAVAFIGFFAVPILLELIASYL